MYCIFCIVFHAMYSMSTINHSSNPHTLSCSIYLLSQLKRKKSKSCEVLKRFEEMSILKTYMKQLALLKILKLIPVIFLTYFTVTWVLRLRKQPDVSQTIWVWFLDYRNVFQYQKAIIVWCFLFVWLFLCQQNCGFNIHNKT